MYTIALAFYDSVSANSSNHYVLLLSLMIYCSNALTPHQAAAAPAIKAEE